ncbi:hypothetical protein ABIB07_004549 [Bradyrhizobium sp. RT10b]
MATGDFLNLLSEPFTRDTPLKFDREKSVVSSRKNTNGDVGPAREATGLAENGLGFLAWFRGGAQHVLGYIVQKVSFHIEFRRIPAASRSLFPCFDRSCCIPPCTGGLVGLGDHRVDEQKHPHGRRPANKGRREARKRLSDEYHAASFRYRADNDLRIRGETGVPVVARQIDAMASCPAAQISGVTRCQYQAMPPAPGTRTNVAMLSFLRCCWNRPSRACPFDRD